MSSSVSEDVEDRSSHSSDTGSAALDAGNGV